MLEMGNSTCMTSGGNQCLVAQKLGIVQVVRFIFKNKKGEKKTLLDRAYIFCLLKLWHLSPSKGS